MARGEYMICGITKKCKTNNKSKKTKVCWHEVAIVVVVALIVVAASTGIVA